VLNLHLPRISEALALEGNVTPLRGAANLRPSTKSTMVFIDRVNYFTRAAMLRMLLYAVVVAQVSLTCAMGQKTAQDCQEPYRQELSANPKSSLVRFRLAECLFKIKDRASAANEFREALNGDLQPSWTKVCPTSTGAKSSIPQANVNGHSKNTDWLRKRKTTREAHKTKLRSIGNHPIGNPEPPKPLG
jgi:hypothetical protein